MHVQKDYILFGIQGAGKGTQGKILAEEIGAAYFEMGGELRKLAREDSELGQKVKSIIEAGHLVPHEVVMEIVASFATKAGKDQPIIFDGIPRDEIQDSSFRGLMEALGRDYSGVYFEIPREEAEKRLLTRRVCENCKAVYPALFNGEKCSACGGKLVTRADDNADAIRTRIEIFYKETLPLIETWKSLNKMISVNGIGSIEEVTRELFQKIGL